MSEKLLEIKDLEVIYKTEEETVRAVNGINLEVNAGRLWAWSGNGRRQDNHRPVHHEAAARQGELHQEWTDTA